MRLPRWAQTCFQPDKLESVLDELAEIKFLYHGCSEETAHLALTEGLKPRAFTRAGSNWEDMESCPDFVYLSRVYAGYFALCAQGDSSKVGFIRVRASALRPECLFPDEDAVEQISRGSDLLPDEEWEDEDGETQMRKRTAFIRDNPHLFQHLYGASLTALGNIAHEGVISPEHIAGIRIFDTKVHPYIAATLLDPSINVLNFRIMGAKYDALTRWVFGESPTPEELLGFPHIEGLPAVFKEHNARFLAQFEDRSGIEVLK